MLDKIEICSWIDWQKKIPSEIKDKRIYFGHETCEKLLPEYKEISHIINFSRHKNIQLTFVTPFLSENGIDRVIQLIYKLHNEVENFEVVLSDWGLLDWVCNNKIGIPIISRFLIGQQVDYRYSRLLSNELSNDKLISISDNHYRLKQKIISDEFKDHISCCSLLNQKVIEYFNKIGIFRFEISNVFQSVILNNNGLNAYSIHVPFVPLSIMRWCPDGNEDFNSININCVKQNCSHKISKWDNLKDHIDIFRFDNCIYYKNEYWESKILENQNIDRVVFNFAAIK